MRSSLATSHAQLGLTSQVAEHLSRMCVERKPEAVSFENKMEFVMQNMKSALLSALAAISTLTVASTEFAQAAPYVSLGGGASFSGNSNIDYRNTATSPAVNGTT